MIDVVHNFRYNPLQSSTFCPLYAYSIRNSFVVVSTLVRLFIIVFVLNCSWFDSYAPLVKTDLTHVSKIFTLLSVYYFLSYVYIKDIFAVLLGFRPPKEEVEKQTQ